MAQLMNCWVAMGYFDERGDGRVVELDASDGSIRTVLAFDPPERLSVPRKGFAGAAWMDGDGRGDLLICGAAAVFRFETSSLKHVGTLAQPSFNDLHGVAVAGDRIYVVNTGMDCVEGFDREGLYLGSLGFEAPWLTAMRQAGRVPGVSTWDAMHRIGWSGVEPRFEPEVSADPYYSRSSDIPFSKRAQRDFVHLNHVTVIDGRVLVTSLARRGVIDLSGWRQLITVESPPHDGVVVDGRHYLTRVDGYLEVRAVEALGGAPEVHDLTTSAGVAGWCRGVHVSGEIVWVGFTEIRRQPVPPWSRSRFDATRTAVLALRRGTMEVVARFDLGDRCRHAKVMGIFAPSVGHERFG